MLHRLVLTSLDTNNVIVLQVLECLPPDWPIKTVKAFLLHSLRSNIHTFRMERIQHNLARGENLQVSMLP